MTHALIGLTFIRETLRDWVVLFLEEQTDLSPSLSTVASTSYIIAGGLSAIFTGYLLDRNW